MVEKKEGNTMDCRNCGTLLTCREKHYKASGNFAEKTVLQWQNEDGTAHYSTKDGKNFSCNIPEGQEQSNPSQSTLSEPTAYQPPDTSLDAKIDKLIAKANSIQDTCVSILHIVSDIKTQGVKITTGAEQVKEIMEKHNEL